MNTLCLKGEGCKESGMIDACGREISYLRISVTQRCNLDCFYCHHEGETESRTEMSQEKILDVAKCMAELGIKRIKITGGEPLLRDDIVDVVRDISNIGMFRDISITTNGTLLEDIAGPLKDAGLSRVNIGCDSFSSNITPKRMENILPGLIAAQRAGLFPIKLNMVVLKHVNVHEIPAMIEFARRYKFILQLIELIPNGEIYYKRYHFPLKIIERELKRKADKIIVRKLQGRKQYNLNGATLEIVSANQQSFCRNCNKIRVTSDGRIKPCLMRNDNLVVFEGKESVFEALKRRSMYYG